MISKKYKREKRAVIIFQRGAEKRAVQYNMFFFPRKLDWGPISFFRLKKKSFDRKKDATTSFLTLTDLCTCCWSWTYCGCWHQTCPPIDPQRTSFSMCQDMQIVELMIAYL